MADEVLTAAPTVAVLTAVAIPTLVVVATVPMVGEDSMAAALTAVAVLMPVAVAAVPMVAVGTTVVVLAAAATPLQVGVGAVPAVVVDSRAARVLAAAGADTLSAAVLVVEYGLDPSREAVARLDQQTNSIIRHILLRREHLEPTAPPSATASGTRLEAAGVLHLQRHADHLLLSATASGTRLETTGVLLSRRGADHRVRGRVARRGAGMARVAKRRRITQDQPRSRGVRRLHGRQIEGQRVQIEDSRNLRQ
jgi:hypothetical protein